MAWQHRASRRGRLRRGGLSLGLAGLFVGLGLSALPSGAALRDDSLRLIDPARVGPEDGGIGAPVFALRADGTAVRFGDAAPGDTGEIRVTLYDPLDPAMRGATEALSLPGDFRLLWLLASDDERRQLRGLASAVAAGATQSLTAILSSAAFQADYRDSLLDIIQTALTEAWADGRAQAAWNALLASYDPILRDIAAREVRPILAYHFEGIAGRLLRANATRLLDIFDHPDWDTAPIDQAIAGAATEIRDRGIPERTVARLLAPREATQFLRVFLGVACDTVPRGPALLNLLARMAVDARFVPATREVVASVENLARAAPRLMVSLHGSADLNLVASFVIHNVTAGRQDRVVVLMSPAQGREIAALDPRAAHWLRAVAPS